MAGIQNIRAVQNALRRAHAQKVHKLTVGLTNAGLWLLAESKKIVPVDYGDLKASGTIRVIGADTPKVKVQVAYTTGYAVYVHENPDAAHGAAFNEKHAAELAHAKALRKKRQGGTTGPYRHNRGTNQVYKFLEGPFRRGLSTIKFFVKNALGVE